jgi:hypothetical protein
VNDDDAERLRHHRSNPIASQRPRAYLVGQSSAAIARISAIVNRSSQYLRKASVTTT